MKVRVFTTRTKRRLNKEAQEEGEGGRRRTERRQRQIKMGAIGAGCVGEAFHPRGSSSRVL